MSTATKPVRAASDTEGDQAAPARSKRKLVVVLVVVLLVLGGAAYWFVLKPSGGGAHQAPEPGIVTPLDPIQINLAGNHYLKLGLALQASKDAGKEPVDGSKALDAAIEQFSGRDMADLARRAFREQMRRALVKTLGTLYEGKVIGVYFTDFVSQ